MEMNIGLFESPWQRYYFAKFLCGTAIVLSLFTRNKLEHSCFPE